jgi:TetR/AcrR family transcriptional regulator
MNDKRASRKMALEEFTRKGILDSAVNVLLLRGMKGFTVDRVAMEAGIAKGTVYLYYDNKKDLLNTVTDYAFKELEEEYETISNSEQVPVAKLGMYAMASMKHIEKHEKLFKELRNIMFNTIDQHISDNKSWYWKTVDLFAATLDEAIQAGKFRQVNTLKVGALFLNSINSLVAHHILSTVPETIDDDVRDLMDLYLNGLAI